MFSQKKKEEKHFEGKEKHFESFKNFMKVFRKYLLCYSKHIYITENIYFMSKKKIGKQNRVIYYRQQFPKIKKN